MMAGPVEAGGLNPLFEGFLKAFREKSGKDGVCALGARFRQPLLVPQAENAAAE